MTAKGENSDSVLVSQIASRIEGITTHWSVVADTARFTLRYARAIRRYLATRVESEVDTEDILQDFLLRVYEQGFRGYQAEQGKFRFYLKGALRNAVLLHWRKKNRLPRADDEQLAGVPAREAPGPDPWTLEWRACLLERTWEALKEHELRSPGNLFHTVLQLAVDHPEASSERLAALASQRVGRPIRADAFRKQLSRARQRFAELLVQEVAETLESADPEQIEDELAELELLSYVRHALPQR